MTTTTRITTTAWLILSLAATAASAASARPARAEPAGAHKPAPIAVYSRQDKSTIPATAPLTPAAMPARTPTSSGPRSEVVSGGGYSPGAAVYSRQDKLTIPAPAPTQPTRLPPILGALKPSQTAAFRQTEQRERLAYLADHQPNSARYSSAELNAYASGIPTGVPSNIMHVASPNGSFDWGDAGIGAAGGITLLMLGLGGASGVARYRTRHSAGLSG